jgi:hypothetical protein
MSELALGVRRCGLAGRARIAPRGQVWLRLNDAGLKPRAAGVAARTNVHRRPGKI